MLDERTMSGRRASMRSGSGRRVDVIATPIVLTVNNAPLGNGVQLFHRHKDTERAQDVREAYNWLRESGKP